MVNADSPWWQWHYNGSRVKFPMLCCDLYKEISVTHLKIVNSSKL
jgi:hypothetical protein